MLGQAIEDHLLSERRMRGLRWSHFGSQDRRQIGGTSTAMLRFSRGRYAKDGFNEIVELLQ